MVAGTETDKMRRQRNLSQMKEQDKAMARDLSETEFKVMIIKILTGLKNGRHE